MITVGISGASGYVGRELIRLVSVHGQCRLSWLGSREHAGKPLAEVHRALAGISSLNFSAGENVPKDLDVLFVAHPHGESMELIKSCLSEKQRSDRGTRIIDLGADFRLPQRMFESVYGQAHLASAELSHAVYGLPEIWPERLRSAELVANPGCFADCITLALAPLAQMKMLNGTVIVSALTGSSGSGLKVSTKTHHPERNESVSAYDIWTHRHTQEIECQLKAVAQNECTPRVRLVPMSGPFTRGIFATCYVSINGGGLDLIEIYQSFAKERPFIRYRDDSPRVIDVRGTNFCDLTVRQQGDEVVIVAAIDNLVKGAAGNAVQCMNLMFGLDERTGLVGISL